LCTVSFISYKVVFEALAKSGSFGFAEGSALCVGAKPNVPLVRLAKIVFKKVRWQKNKKHWGRLECRLTRCPVAIWSVCFGLPVKMVCLCFNVQIMVGQSSLERSSTIGYNVSVLPPCHFPGCYIKAKLNIFCQA